MIVIINKIYTRILSLAFYVIGMLLLTNKQSNITGAVIGVSNVSTTLTSIMGIVLVFIAVLLFATEEVGNGWKQ